MIQLDIWSRTKRSDSDSQCCQKSNSATLAECPYCFHRSGLDSDSHREWDDLHGVKECRTH